MPLTRVTDSTDDPVAGLARLDEPTDEDTEEAALMLAAAALKALIAEGSLVFRSELSVASFRIVPNKLPPFGAIGFEGLFVMLTAS